MNRVLVSMEDGLPRTEANARFFDLAESGRVEEFVGRVLERLGVDGEEVSVLFCGDEFIRSFNARDRGIDAPTDILEYENGEEYEDGDGRWLVAGDMLISFETLPVNAAEFGADEDEELRRLLVHGVLHLNGRDHGDAHLEPGVPPTDEMLVLQEEILAGLSGARLLP